MNRLPHSESCVQRAERQLCAGLGLLLYVVGIGGERSVSPTDFLVHSLRPTLERPPAGGVRCPPRVGMNPCLLTVTAHVTIASVTASATTTASAATPASAPTITARTVSLPGWAPRAAGLDGSPRGLPRPQLFDKRSQLRIRLPEPRRGIDTHQTTVGGTKYDGPSNAKWIRCPPEFDPHDVAAP